MNTSARKIRIGAAALLGLGLVSGAISAQAAEASTTGQVPSNLQNRTEHARRIFDTRNAFAMERPTTIDSRSDSFTAPSFPDTSQGRIKHTDGRHANSTTVLKYQSPYMSAPY